MNRYQLICTLGCMFVVQLLCTAQEYDIRFELDESSCLPNTVCYVLQLRSSNNRSWGLAGQNYRIYFDGSKASFIEDISYSLLPDNKYCPLFIRQIVENIDASASGMALPFARNLSFVNCSIDLINLAKGGVDLPYQGDWVSTARLCFALSEEVLRKPSTCLYMVWARQEKTEQYAPSYTIISEWVSSYLIQPAKPRKYADLDIFNGCFSTQLMTLEKQDIMCPGDSFGSVKVTIHGKNEPYKVSMEDGSTDLTRLKSGVHELIVVDNKGCQYNRVFEINEPPPIKIEITQMNQPQSSISSDGLIEVEIRGGTLPYTFEWSLGDSLISTSQNLSMVHSGTYNLKVTDVNGCELISENIQLEASTSVNDPEILAGFNFYPNPTSDLVHIDMKDPELKILRIVLLNLRGQVVHIFDKISRYQNSLVVEDFDPGLYIIRLELEDDISVTKRIVKM